MYADDAVILAEDEKIDCHETFRADSAHHDVLSDTIDPPTTIILDNYNVIYII